MKFLYLFAATAVLASAESHPSWWLYTSPEATALVGIHWDNLRGSPLAEAIQAELDSTGPLAFPDMECLRTAREIVISSPELLAAEAGNFPSAIVRGQASRAGLQRSIYHGVAFWIPQNAANLGIAQISEQIVLIGARKTLESAINNSNAPSGRPYSSLLPRAARFSQTGDLWVVAARLPDPLANLFVPLEIEAEKFEGQVSLRGGLTMEASFDAGSARNADDAVADLRKQAPSLPPIARGLDAESDGAHVTLQLHLSPEEVQAGLHAPAPAAPAVTAAAPTPVAQAPTMVAKAPAPAPIVPAAALSAFAPPPATEPPPPVEPPKPVGPQVIRIIGLESGPREIVIPPGQ